MESLARGDRDRMGSISDFDKLAEPLPLENRALVDPGRGAIVHDQHPVLTASDRSSGPLTRGILGAEGLKRKRGSRNQSDRLDQLLSRERLLQQ